jgi:hypothetical protein
MTGGREGGSRVQWGRTAALSWGFALLLAAPAVASPVHGGNCALYARSITGIDLAGDAGAWWPNAEGRYQRSQEPAVGAVLVFKPSGHMRHGHVAVVSRVVNKREVLVDQANWVPGRIVKDMSVVDASPDNDWSMVRVLELHSRTHGRENATYGFIHPHPADRHDGADTVVIARDEVDVPRHSLPVRLAVAKSAASVGKQAKSAVRRRATPAVHRVAELAKTERVKADRAKAEHAKAERGKTDRAKAEQAKADRIKAERAKHQKQANAEEPAHRPKGSQRPD